MQHQTQTVPCLRCETPFERKRRGPVAHYCRACRVARKREYDREYRRQHDEVLSGLRTRLPEEIATNLENYRHVLGLGAADALPLAHDRMPAGSKAPLGSDDGRSTYFTVLAGELDTLARAAVRHTCEDTEGQFAHHTEVDCGQCFWNSEPHWSHGLY